MGCFEKLSDLPEKLISEIKKNFIEAEWMPNSINRSRRRHSLYYPERLANLWGAALWFSKNAIESYKTVYRKCYNLNPKREVDFDCEKIKVGWSKMKVSGLDFNFIESPNARALTICVELK